MKVSSILQIGKRVVVSSTMALLLFAPFTALQAQAQTTGSTGTSNSTQQGGDPFANCGISGAYNNGISSAVGSCITGAVYVFTIGLGSAIAYLAANLFDTAVQLSLNSAAYGLDFVSAGWTTARDLANMTFLFILIYIAFIVIFRAETSNTMSMLAGVIVIALLVNFSFFFSRLIIDGGNILAIEFYNSIPAPPISQSPVQKIPIASTALQYIGANQNEKDLTASIMNMLQVQNLLNSQSFSSASGTGSVVATIFIYIAAAIILWILTVTFATNAAKFLFRIVALWLLIIVSPLAFVAAAVQGFNQGYFKQWREQLFANALYPVAFMFIFLLLSNFANEAANSSLLGNVFDQLANTKQAGWGTIIGAITSVGIRLALVVGVMMVGMKLSDRFSVAGASAANRVGNWAGNKFIGAYGAVGRNTIGLAGYKIAQNGTVQQWAARDGVIGRNLWRGANKVGSAGFDARNVLKSVGVKDATGLNMKAANKGGYKAKFDASVKGREAEAKKFGSLTDEQKKIIEENVKSAAATDLEQTRRSKEAADVAQANAQSEFNDAQKEANRLQNEVKRASGEIEKLKDMNKTGTPEMENVHNARAEAIRRLDEHKETILTEKSGKLDAAKKDTQTFSTKIEELNKKIQKDIKDEQTKATPKNIYADSIAGKGPLKMFGNFSRAGWIPTADKVARDRIKKEKSKEQKAADAIKELSDDGNKKEEDKKE